MFSGLKILTGLINNIQSNINEYVSEFYKLDDAQAAVRKTTGMTQEEVEALNESLKKIDTRTSVEELNKIAEQGGRIGVAKKDIGCYRLQKYNF